MNLCTNLRECLEENRETLPAVQIKSHPPSSIHIPYLWRLMICQELAEYLPHLFTEFLPPFVMPNLQQFNFSLEPKSNIVPTLIELTAIVNGLSPPNLISELIYPGEDRLIEVTSTLPFVTSLTVRHSVLTSSTIWMMAQKDGLPNLTSLRLRSNMKLWTLLSTC